MEKTEIKMTKSPAREYFYDYWRAFMVIVVLIHHSYLSYVIGYDWYVNDLVQALPYTWFSIILDMFMMPIMFFIAGYFAFPSIKKGVKRFVLKKVFRIAIPFVIGVLFLAPIMMYMYVISHFPLWDINFFDFWLNYYFTDVYMDPSHYWFLSLLLFFFIIFGAVYAIIKKKLFTIYENSKEKPAKKRNIILFLMGFLLSSIVLFYLTGLAYPDGSWYYFMGIRFLKLQLTRSILYLLYFVLGILVFIKRIKFSEKILKFTPVLIVLSIVSTVAIIFFKFDIILQAYIDLGFLPANLQFYNAIVQILYCFLIFITLMAVFQNYLNRRSKVFSRIASNSYKIYLVHLIWVVIIQYLLLEIPIDVFFKFLITAIGAFGLSLCTSEVLRLIKRGFVGILKLKK